MTVAELGLMVEGSSLLCRYCSFSPFFFFLFFYCPSQEPSWAITPLVMEMEVAEIGYTCESFVFSS